MEAAHVCALALLAAGVAFLVFAAVAVALLPGPWLRLHALSVATSVGFPLLCLSLAIEAGVGRAAAKVLFIGVLSAVAGPVTSVAVGRAGLEERAGSKAGSAA